MPENKQPPSVSQEEAAQIAAAEQALSQGPPQPPKVNQSPTPPPQINTPSEVGGITTPTDVGGDISAEDLAISEDELTEVLRQYQDESGKVDPVLARYAVKYFELWGVPPPPGYIENIISQGMNIYEFEDFERSKPSFRRTETYQDEFAQAAAAVARLLGLR
jgi:hypothetical protein